MSTPLNQDLQNDKNIPEVQQNSAENFIDFSQNTEILSNLNNFLSVSSPEDIAKSNKYL